MGNQLLIYGINILYLTCTPVLFGAFMERKPKWNIPLRLFVYLGASIFFTFSLYKIIEAFPVSTILRTTLLLMRTAVCLLVISLPYRGSVLRRLVSVLLILMFVTVSEQIAIVILAFIRGIAPVIIAQDQDYTYSIQGVGDVLGYTGIVLVGLFRRRQQKAQTSPVSYLLVSVVPLASIVFAVAFFYSRDYVGISNPGTTMQIWTFIIVINLLVCLLFGKLEETYAQNQQLALEQQHYQLRDEYYRQVEAHQKEIRMIKHDLKNQLLVLNAAVADSPLDPLIQRLSQQTRYDFTAHAAVNAILGAKYQQAAQEHIICEFEARLPEDMRIASTDLAALTGNILDNAIEACRYCENRRYIRFRCLYHNGSLVVSCENSTDGKVRSIKTRKRDVFKHGIGMESIMAVVNRYDGEMQYEFAAYHFTINLTLFEIPVTRPAATGAG